jgi:hypothetical protein
MSAFPYWIQRADFSSSDHTPVGVGDAVRVFEHHDWPAELRLYAELESEGKECCPPGIGYVASDGGILHICPDKEGNALTHYHFGARAKLFGFIPRTIRTTTTREAVPRSSIVNMIGLFFDGHHDLLLEGLAGGMGSKTVNP